MKHASTRLVAAHWNKIRGRRRVPERAEIDPSAIRGALCDTFILSQSPMSSLAFRLAGTRLCGAFGQELKGTAFPDLWDEGHRPQIEMLATTVADEFVGVIGGGIGWTDEGYSVDLEWLLLPLRHRGQSHVRLLGSMAPLEAPYWLGNSPIMTVALNGYRYTGPEVNASSPRHQFGGRWRHGLRIYDGGLTEISAAETPR
jgi:hypothetical protein